MSPCVNLRQVAAETPLRLKALTQPSSIPGHGLINIVVLVIVKATVHVGAYQVLLVVVCETQVVPPWNREHCQCELECSYMEYWEHDVTLEYASVISSHQQTNP